MIETIVVIGILGAVMTSITALWHKMGKLQTKVDFIYENIKTVVTFKSNNK